MKMKFIFSALLIASVGTCFAHGDHRQPKKYFYLQPEHRESHKSNTENSFIGLAGTNAAAAPFDNGVCLLIVTVIGIGLIKAYDKKKQEAAPVVVEKIY